MEASAASSESGSSIAAAAMPGVTLQGGIVNATRGDETAAASSATTKFKLEDLYTTESRLRSGSYGTVYTCHHKADPQTTYAVKIMDRSKLKKVDDESVFREVSILSELVEHEHVIRLVDFFVEPQRLCVVQVLAVGGDVFDRLAQRSVYTENDARHLARILLEAIDGLHSVKPFAIIHRDLKPENLLLKDEKNDSSILLADFGFSRHVTEEGCRTRCGTPAFVAYVSRLFLVFLLFEYIIFSKSSIILLFCLMHTLAGPRLCWVYRIKHRSICGALDVLFTCLLVDIRRFKARIIVSYFAKCERVILSFTTSILAR